MKYEIARMLICNAKNHKNHKNHKKNHKDVRNSFKSEKLLCLVNATSLGQLILKVYWVCNSQITILFNK